MYQEYDWRGSPLGYRRSRFHRVTEAHRALELLEDYHSKLNKSQDKQLRLAIERVIRIFKSRLFQALLDSTDSGSDNSEETAVPGCSGGADPQFDPLSDHSYAFYSEMEGTDIRTATISSEQKIDDTDSLTEFNITKVADNKAEDKHQTLCSLQKQHFKKRK